MQGSVSSDARGSFAAGGLGVTGEAGGVDAHAYPETGMFTTPTPAERETMIEALVANRKLASCQGVSDAAREAAASMAQALELSLGQLRLSAVPPATQPALEGQPALIRSV